MVLFHWRPSTILMVARSKDESKWNRNTFTLALKKKNDTRNERIVEPENSVIDYVYNQFGISAVFVFAFVFIFFFTFYSYLYLDWFISIC